MENRLQYLDELNPNTKSTYLNALKHFFNHLFGEGELTNLANQYFVNKRDYGEDLKDFLVSIKERPPKTVNLYLSAVRTFLVENDIELPEKYWRRVRGRVKGSMARTRDRVPSNEQLKRIIMHMPVHGKGLFLTLASSGMRIGEILKLKLDDIYLNETPCRIEIRGEYTKSGNPRTTFISGEAKEYVEEYLRNRTRYLASKRSRHGKSIDDKRLFPFEDTTALFIWKTAIDKAKFNDRDKSTNRYEFHPHVLRKFFRSRMSTLIPVDFVEKLMGHEGYLTEVYRRYSMEDLIKFYKQGESSLSVFIASNLKVEFEESKQQLQTLVNGLVAENMELKQRVSIVENGWKKFELLYNDLVKFGGQKKADERVFRLDVDGHIRERAKENPVTQEERDMERELEKKRQ